MCVCMFVCMCVLLYFYRQTKWLVQYQGVICYPARGGGYDQQLSPPLLTRKVGRKKTGDWTCPSGPKRGMKELT
jgi:hypothetical protein